MKSTLTLLCILAAVLTLAIPAAAQDPGIRDTVAVDSVVAFTSGVGVVPVRFVNDDTVSSLEVVLQHFSPNLVIDSFSFIGGRLAGANFTGFTLRQDSSILTVFSLPQDPILPGSGLLGKIYISYPASVSPDLYLLDTTTYQEGQIVHTTEFRGPDSNPVLYVPEFRQGYLDIQDPPTAFDSVWIDDYQTTPSEPLAIDVNFFNEAEVETLVVALNWQDTLLHYDSVSFAGTRDLPPVTNPFPVQAQNSSHQLRLKLAFSTNEPLLPGTGTVAKLWFTVSDNPVETTLIVDTTTFAGVVSTKVTRTPVAGGNEFVPIVNPGSVEIRIPTDVKDITEGELPIDFTLAQNYPNPFNPTTTIEFSLPVSADVEIDIFNVLGQQVRRLVDQTLPAGRHLVTFDGRSDGGSALASGVYFYRIKAEDFTQSKKMLLIK